MAAGEYFNTSNYNGYASYIPSTTMAKTIMGDLENGTLSWSNGALSGSATTATITTAGNSTVTFGNGLVANGGYISYDPGYVTNTFIGYNATVNTTFNGETITLGGSLDGTTYISGNDYFKIPDFSKENVEIRDGNVYIDGVIELNPTKIGKAILMSIEKDRKIEDNRDFFNKD